MNTYKIYTLSEDKKTKKYYGIDTENGDKLCFESDSEIIEYVEKIRKETNLPYMWQRVRDIRILNKENKVEKTFESTEEHFNYIMEKNKNKKWYKKTWDYISHKWYFFGEKWRQIKYGFERMFSKYDRTVAWNIDYALFDLLKKNIPKLIENTHGCPNSYVLKAVKMMNPDITEEELKNINGTSEQTNIGMALWRNDLEKFVEMCKLVTYYENYGIQETNDEDWIDPLKYPIPYEKFSKEIDYEKLSELQNENLDNIFKFLREHIMEMWD